MADILQITLPDGSTYNLKDSTAVTNIAYDSSTYNITKTINGTITNVLQMPCRTGTGTNSLIAGDLVNNIASGESSFAAGGSANINNIMKYQTASGKFSFTAGAGNTASGDSTVVLGINNTASGKFSIAIGNSNTAAGWASFAGGEQSNSTSTGHYSLAFGYQNETQGVVAVALGAGTKAKAQASTTLGQYTIASGQCSFVTGQCNIEDTGTASDNPFNAASYKKYAFIIGNGTADNARSNALTVDWYGNISANNIVTSTSVSNTGLISFLNSNSTTVYTTQLPTYDGSVTGGSPGSNRYVVTITYDENEDEYSADKTFAQVYAACEAGKVVQAYIDNYGTYYSLNFYNESAIAFGFLDAETIYLYEFVINDDETISSYEVQLQST